MGWKIYLKSAAKWDSLLLGIPESNDYLQKQNANTSLLIWDNDVFYINVGKSCLIKMVPGTKTLFCAWHRGVRNYTWYVMTKLHLVQIAGSVPGTNRGKCTWYN